VAEVMPDKDDVAEEQPGEVVAAALRVIAFVVTSLGMVSVFGAGRRLTGSVQGMLPTAPFLVWALFPFVLALFGLRRGAYSAPRGAGVILTSGFGLVMYADLVLASRLSSTAGLALIFIPLWQAIGCSVVLLLTIGRVREVWRRLTSGCS
jgi:hypothetical protein